MIPVYQSLPDPVSGDCLSACLASLLELRLEDVPRFFGAHKTDVCWYLRLDEWLAARGLRLFVCLIEPDELDRKYLVGQTVEDENIVWPTGLCIMMGTSPRNTKHAVIGHAGTLIHDPYPSGGGLARVEGYLTLARR